MKETISFSLLLLLIGSCTKEASIKLPPQEEKLVVTCFISPEDTMITAVVRTSSPRYNTPNANFRFESLPNAEVKITSSDGSVILPYQSDFGYYGIKADQFPIQAGRSYTIDVNTPDGKKTSASTTVPADTLPIKALILSLQFSEDSTHLEISTTAEVSDLQGQINYVGLYFRTFYFSNDTTVPGNGYIDFGYGTFDDDEKQARHGYVFQERNASMESSQKIEWQGMFAELWALNCSKEFYLYNRSVQRASNGGGNPFGDPVMVYTNMSNGFGCFGGFRVTKRAVLR